MGRQSPRVVPYPAHSLCPGEPGLQSAAGKATVCASVRWSGCQRLLCSAGPSPPLLLPTCLEPGGWFRSHLTGKKSLKNAKAPKSVCLLVLPVNSNYPKSALSRGKAAVCIRMLSYQGIQSGENHKYSGNLQVHLSVSHGACNVGARLCSAVLTE